MKLTVKRLNTALIILGIINLGLSLIQSPQSRILTLIVGCIIVFGLLNMEKWVYYLIIIAEVMSLTFAAIGTVIGLSSEGPSVLIGSAIYFIFGILIIIVCWSILKNHKFK